MNIMNFLRKYLTTKSPTVTPAQITAAQSNLLDKKLLRRAGLIQNDLRDELNKQSLIQFERSSLYTTLDRSLAHPLMSAAVGLFADTATNFNRINNGTVWCETESKEYRYQIEKLLDILNIEENIYDYAWQVCAFGDLFVRVFGEPGVGIVHIDDNAHPIDVSRLDFNGRLVGFYETPQGYFTSQQSPLLSPWEFVHFKLTGSKKRRMSGSFGNEQYNEYRTVSIMTPDARRITNCYGSSILSDALPIWKRLRLSEDSVMMSRITRGVLRYIYKIVIDKQNCLVGETPIKLLDGTTPTIKEMAENKEKYVGKYLPSINPRSKELEADKILDVKKTRLNAEVIRVWLDSNEYIDCTPDHRFMLRNGEFKEAQNLVEGESVMPYYTKFNLKSPMRDYELVYNPGDNKYHYTHRFILRGTGAVLTKGKVVHHKDHNKLNNDPSNLQLMETEEHLRYHHENGVRNWLKNLKGKKQTEEHKQRRIASFKATFEKNKFKYHETNVCLNCGKEYDHYINNNNGKKFCSADCYGEYSKNKKDNTIYEDRLCKCGVVFRCRIKEKRKYCSDKCSLELGKTGENKLCLNCGSPFYVHKFLLNSIKFCSKKCGLEYSDKTFAKHKIVRKCSSCGKSFYGNSGIQGKRKECASCYLINKKEKILNHKIVRIEKLSEKVDTYDITTERNHNFALGQGIFVHNSNSDAVLQLLDGYIDSLKRARSIDTNTGNYQDRFNAPAGMEDIILPVWGEAGNLSIEKIGGEVDIKWIADIEEQQRQLATALKIPLPLLAGYADKAGGFEQGSALEKLDIRFARQARRIQRALIAGITRLVQIHLAYQGINPDLNLFKIKMSETSTAEEIEIVNSLNTSVDVAQKVFQLYDDAVGVDLDKKQLIEFLNNKILKLTDIEIDKLILKGNKDAFKPVSEKPLSNEPNPFRESISPDLKSALPLDKKEVEKVNESTGEKEKVVVAYENKEWNKNWAGKKVTIKEIKQKGKK